MASSSVETAERVRLAAYLFQRVELPAPYTFDGQRLTIGDLVVEIPSLPAATPREVPVLGVSLTVRRHSGGPDCVEVREGGRLVLRMGVDVLGELEDYLTLQHEGGPQECLDGGPLSTQVRRLIDLPLADLLIHFFLSILKGHVPLRYKKWDGKYDFALCVTHDVDRTGDNVPYRMFKNVYFGVRSRRPSLLLRALAPENDDFQFRRVLDLEKEYAVESSAWFFLSSTRRILGCSLPRHGDYSLTNEYAQEGMRLLHDRERGLHIPFVNLDAQSIHQEIKNTAPHMHVRGVRSHYLRGVFPDLLVELEKLGLTYDSTFGFNDVPSFRFGTSYPFCPNVDGRRLNIMEVPLNIMDVHVHDLGRFQDYLRRLFPLLRATHSVCVANWHPHRFNQHQFGDIYERAFEELLSAAKEHGAWLTSIEHLLEVVKQREVGVN